MRTGLAAGVAFAVMVLSVGPVHAQGKGPRGGDEREAVRNGWLFSLEEGKAQARKTGKPLMVVIRCVP